MAKQHFYSRVPARMSIFNRTDSFDTFAYSDGLEREFVEKELAAVYANPPSKIDAGLIRDGKLPPLYCQLVTKSGVLAQGSISFLPLDYTKERSAYFSHILLPNENEENKITYSPDNAVLNPAMFKHDLADFDLTSPEATPNENYPELTYKTVKAANPSELVKYDSAMLKRLIFAMLNLVCGKGKNIFISLPFGIDKVSTEALNFMNSLLQIFPYHMRRNFSFVTYTNDVARFGAFNIRFIPENAPEVPISKGMTLHFGSKISIGLSDEQVIANTSLVEFFYSLLRNDEIRRSFLEFINAAVEKNPALKKINLKTLNELVFIFQQCSGLYNEKNILPNDAKLYEFICAYEKHRNSLSDEYRAVALKCLSRYPKGHLVIPKDVFSRTSKIYPAEPDCSKRTVMDVILALIHTDLMRDKLFAFIKSNYQSESPEVRSEICENLCRVYYGGFLQAQILNFFKQVFAEESEITRDLIVEKLLLTIRTESVKDSIVTFLDENYDLLTDTQKGKLYNVFFEMLPESDELSKNMVALVNRNITKENEEFIASFSGKLYSVVEKNQKSNEAGLLYILLSISGFCCNVVTKEIVSLHTQEKIFEYYVLNICLLPTERKVAVIDEIFVAIPDMPLETATLLAQKLSDANETEPLALDLYALIDLDTRFSSCLEVNGPKKVFAEIYLNNVIRPALCRSLPEAFNVKKRRDGLQYLVDYAKDKPYINFAPEYRLVSAYANICDGAINNDRQKMLAGAVMLADKNARFGVIEHLKMRFVKGNEISAPEYLATRLMLKVIIAYLSGKEKVIDFSGPYSETVAELTGSICAENQKQSRDAAELTAANTVISEILRVAEDIYLSSDFEEYRPQITMQGSSLALTISSYVSKQKRGVKRIDEYLTYNKFNAEFTNDVIRLMNSLPSSGGFLKKIFGR